MLHIASPKSARISTNNLPRAMPMFGIAKANPVITHNDAKVIKLLGESAMKTTSTEKLFTADEMAAKLGISTSYVYAKLSKLQAEPTQKVGKQAFYSGNLLEQMGTRQRRQRRAVTVQEFQNNSKLNLEIVPKSLDNSKQNPETLLDRVANLEKQLEKLQGIEQALQDIKKLLGTS